MCVPMNALIKHLEGVIRIVKGLQLGRPQGCIRSARVGLVMACTERAASRGRTWPQSCTSYDGTGTSSEAFICLAAW